MGPQIGRQMGSPGGGPFWAVSPSPAKPQTARLSPDKQVPQVSKLTVSGVLDCRGERRSFKMRKVPPPPGNAGRVDGRGRGARGEHWAPQLLHSGEMSPSKAAAGERALC